MEAILLTTSILSGLFGTICPGVDTMPTFLIVGIHSLKGVPVLKMNGPFAMRTALQPLPFKDAAIEEQGSVTFSFAPTPLACVGCSIHLHHSIAASLSLPVTESHIDSPFLLLCSLGHAPWAAGLLVGRLWERSHFVCEACLTCRCG